MRERRRLADDRRAPTGRTRDASASKRGVAKKAQAETATPVAVLRQFRQLFRESQRHFQRIEARCGISGAQLWSLSELDRRPGLTISEVARTLSIHLSTASNLLDKLESQSLVRRERRSDDQRLVRVYVTPAGRKLLAKAPKPVEGVIPGALGKLGAPALRRLHRDLQALLDIARAGSPRDAMTHLAEP